MGRNGLRDAGIRPLRDASTGLLGESGAAYNAGWPLNPTETGQVPGDTNAVGVDGLWIPYLDGFNVGTLEVAGTKACVSGTAVELDASLQPWAVRLTLLLDWSPAADAAWDGSAYSGMSFDLEASSDGAESQLTAALRSLRSTGLAGTLTSHVAPATTGHNALVWSDFAEESADAPEPLDPSRLTHFEVRLSPPPPGTLYSVCVDDLAVF